MDVDIAPQSAAGGGRSRGGGGGGGGGHDASLNFFMVSHRGCSH